MIVPDQAGHRSRPRLRVAASAAGMLAAALLASLPAAPVAAQPAATAPAMTVLQVRPDFYMFTVNGVNIGVEIGPLGVVVVDTGPASAAPALLARIRQLSNQPIRFVVDTSADQELIGGNEALSAAGRSLMIGWNLLGRYQNDDAAITDHLLDTRAPIIARQGVLDRLVSDSANSGRTVSQLALPSETFTRPQYNFRINGDVVNVVRMPPAHSDADSVVLFRRADVVVTGAIFDLTHFPVIDLAHGGSINGEIDAIDQIMNTLAVPSGPVVDSEDGTLIIPLRGAVCNQPDLLTYRDMLYAVRARVQSLIAQHKSLKQVEDADPTQGYERRFGATSGSWTTRNFVDAVYHSLQDASTHHTSRGG
jgi:glyoxylase-like metal-dependent hydrolase (beta-lactamase superfamily II)